MDTDLMLVVGSLALVLSIPSLMSAWIEGQVPRIGSILVLIGGVLVVMALTSHGRPYTFAELPDVFLRVFARWMP
ncbi:hypothetical protein [Stagnihabitans tardus]|uniref:50S ribosomal protein L35 n=1 Tax=Stagnihabitans tardus TaxID=2699202 RepID=A0AAE4YBH8_9RHOB|nr:hypothetical protein [Stagnihabitans tardus]NBZ88193.1 hypothetical protein [Stagnihabitans tardus]